MSGKPRRLYAAYMGEELVCIGTADEVAAACGVKRVTVYNGCASSTQARRREASRPKGPRFYRLGPDEAA